jgi:hypothetical protein
MIGLRRCITDALVIGTITLFGAACSEQSATATEPERPAIPSFAAGPCKVWSCVWGQCGYDPASDPRGACCIAGGSPGTQKPSCRAPW